MMIGLDGFDQNHANELISLGLLPTVRRLSENSAVVPLEHGDAKRTGLSWEHVSTGLSPNDAKRWSPVDFDPQTYGVKQKNTTLPPFASRMQSRVVVFDPPYFDLNQAPSVQGIVGWGAHSAGTDRMARPAPLADEIKLKFGPYPAEKWLYGFVWPSENRTKEMVEALVTAVDLRAEVSHWLFSERCREWELGYLVVSELHSAVEALWHGVDSRHPLHGLPSAGHAGEGIRRIYQAIDRLLERLVTSFPDTTFVVFNMHGMGSNDSDIASMALLPELLYRYRFGKPYRLNRKWPTTALGVPVITSGRSWTTEVTG